MGFKASEKRLLESAYGPLTDAGVEKVMTALGKHEGTAACQACYGTEWTITRDLLFMRCWHEHNRGFTFVAVVCDECGNTRLFESDSVGLGD